MKISGKLELSVEVGAVAGGFVKATGNKLAPYTIFKADGREFYTDPAGYRYRCMDYAPNPLNPDSSK